MQKKMLKHPIDIAGQHLPHTSRRALMIIGRSGMQLNRRRVIVPGFNQGHADASRDELTHPFVYLWSYFLMRVKSEDVSILHFPA